MICDENCLECPFPDCILTRVTQKAYAQVIAANGSAKRKRLIDAERKSQETSANARLAAAAKRKDRAPKLTPEEKNARRRELYAVNRAKINARRRELYAENREQRLAKDKAYREAHKAEINARKRKRNAERRDEINEKQRKYRGEHREELNAQKRAQYAANKEKINAARREKRAANKEIENEKCRAYYQAHRETILARQKVYDATPERKAAHKEASRRWWEKHRADNRSNGLH